MTPPKPPASLRTTGKHLWTAVTRGWELTTHEELLLLQACRVADLCDALATVVGDEGPLRAGRANPAVVELRQQQQLLGRLIVALRIPVGDEDAKASQRRGVRGFYGLRGAAS